MAMSGDVTADAFDRALSTLFNLGQAGIDWASVGRAIVAFREEQHQRWLDAHDGPQEISRGQPLSGDAAAGGAAAALYIEVNGALLAFGLRAGRDWQRLLQDSSPALKVAVDEYVADPDPSARVTEALVNQVVIFMQVVGEFFRDQGAKFERELLELQDTMLGRHGDGAAVRRLGRQKD